MPLGKTREKVLYGLARKRPVHKYTLIRWAVAVLFTLGVASLPFFDLLRFDFWGGRHVYLGEERGLVEVTKAFVFPFLAINVGIILASRLVGRYLCGFVCPVGTIARLAEWLRWSSRREERLFGNTTLFLFSFVLVLVAFAFWVDLRVFVEGSAFARAISAGIVLSGTATLFIGAKRVGLRFCHDWCPSGVYFAVLGPETSNGIDFTHPEACTGCKACERVCPMDLQPTEMVDGERRGGSGFYPDGLSNYALCIRCGDCVVACAATMKPDDPIPLRMGFLPKSEPERGDAAVAQAVEREE